MDSIGFWSTFQPKKLGWRSPYIGSRADILPQILQRAAIRSEAAAKRCFRGNALFERRLLWRAVVRLPGNRLRTARSGHLGNWKANKKGPEGPFRSASNFYCGRRELSFRHVTERSRSRRTSSPSRHLTSRVNDSFRFGASPSATKTSVSTTVMCARFHQSGSSVVSFTFQCPLNVHAFPDESYAVPDCRHCAENIHVGPFFLS